MTKIRNAAIFCLLTIILFSGQAAGAPGYAGSMPPVVWTGPYVGVFAGYSWADLKYAEPDFPGYELEPELDGFMGGGFAGFNFQTGGIVLGFEIDAGGGDLNEDPNPGANNTYSAFDINWNMHLLARIGVPLHTTLLYAVGGMEAAGVTLDDRDTERGENDANHVGWAVGGGIEQVITRNFHIRVEYLYDDYGKEDYTIPGPVPYRSEIDLTAHTVRAGLVFCF